MIARLIPVTDFPPSIAEQEEEEWFLLHQQKDDMGRKAPSPKYMAWIAKEEEKKNVQNLFSSDCQF